LISLCYLTKHTVCLLVYQAGGKCPVSLAYIAVPYGGPQDARLEPNTVCLTSCTYKAYKAYCVSDKLCTSSSSPDC
jgi:hypothetical protein